MNEIEKKELNCRITMSAADLVDGLLTQREGMAVDARTDLILQELIDLKVQTKMLPITMRKLYAYKIASIEKKLNEKKSVPLVMRKRLLYESLISA